MKKTSSAGAVAVAALGLALFAPPGAASAADITPVTPAPPVFRDACGTDSDEVVIPFTQGVDYYMSGVKVNAGVRKVNPASPRAEVFTRAQSGYALSASATWSHTFDDERGCDGDVYVKTGNVEPGESTAPAEPTPTESPTSVAVSSDGPTGRQNIGGEDGELPRTGFASDVMMGLAVTGLLGAGALAAVNRRLSREDGKHAR